MATLPTLTVTDAQANKAWLLAQIKAKVMETELAQARADAMA